MFPFFGLYSREKGIFPTKRYIFNKKQIPSVTLFHLQNQRMECQLF